MYKVSGILCVVGGALTAIALSMAQDAHADEASYINGVADRGTPVTSMTLTVGHQVCADVSANGVDGMQREANLAFNAGVSTYDAASLIGVAVREMCPSNLPALQAWSAAHL